ncbi:MAG TPA: hypothetical protein VH372_24040 [Actinospica sp.]|jgi:hypothetical protein|nr:hypothetical protein [Actinospica sp.]
MTTDSFHNAAVPGLGDLRTEDAADPRPGPDGQDLRETDPYSESEQDEVAARLEALGYID